ncbi:potassium transporter [Orientia tsutsugamushi]|uniref:Potassium transporter n=1 Tax=Orientia tsutsugamushi TaxID=784 RepID=A0A2U3RB74_ORITS|nr:cation:proton antiporter [Orientia tsutsugamushi]SPR10418.1 potassium transporter [Orientia tsutsugamushi]
MESYDFLPNIVILLATAICIVIVFKKLKLSPVLGYLVAGALIGDHGLKIVNVQYTSAIAEFGVVFLLFAIGLELSIERLKAMRRYVFGLGSLQVIITSVIIGGCVMLYYDNVDVSIIIGTVLALSSTAIVLQVIEESRSQSSQVGRVALSVLLMQDFAVVPLLVILPMLSNKTDISIAQAMGIALIKAIIALIVIFITGQLFLRPLFKVISIDKTPGSTNELFIATTLLIVLSAAWGTSHQGLSLALGAFVSGILVAETEFRLQAEESIYPFKGLLLGLFFMSVGMHINVNEIIQNLQTILVCSIGLILIKATIVTGLCILFNFNKSIALHTGLLLSQGSEFAFILFNEAMKEGIIENSIGKTLLLVVTCTMALTPLLSVAGAKIADLLGNGKKEEYNPLQIIEQGARDLTNHIIIAGFGRVGRMVANVLEAENIRYIAIDINEQAVKEDNHSSFPIVQGDISQVDTLKALGIERASAVILSLSNEITIKKTLKAISNNFSHIAIIVKAKDLQRSNEFYECGATVIVPSDYEVGLQLGSEVLKVIGISDYEVNRIKNQFRSGNYVATKQSQTLDNDDENE